MKKILIFTLLVFAGTFVLQAQDYSTGVGFRGGLSNGVTIKHFIGSSTAIEGILSSRWRGFNITGLYEIDNDFDVDRLHWYYGFGGHVGFWSGKYSNPWFNDNKAYTVIGVDAILGLEYNFEEIPVNLSLDWKPAYNLIGYSGFWGDEGAFSIRYIF